MTEAEKRALTTFGNTRWQVTAPFGPNVRGWQEWHADCPSKHAARTAGVRPEKSARMGRGNR